MKIILPLIISILFLTKSFGQSNFQIKDRIFHGFEFEIEQATYPSNPTNFSNSWNFNKWESAGLNWSYFFRLNILELGSDQSISLGCNPILGLRFGFNRQRSSFNAGAYNDLFGFGSLHLPFTFNYHIGKGSTKNATYRFGLTLSVGKEFRLDPIFYFSDSPGDRDGLERYYKGYVVQLGLMREKKRLHQFYIRVVVMRKYSFSFNSVRLANYGFYYSVQTASLGIRFYRKQKN